MVENVMVFINAFILPIISLYIYLKRGKKDLVFNFENLCRYSLFLVVGVIFNKAITVIIRTLLSVKSDLNYSSYTIIGIFTFALLPILFEIAKKHFSIRIEGKNEEEQKK